MNIDFNKLGNKSHSANIDPRDIFMSLPSRNRQYEYPRDVQSEVWKQWFSDRDNKNSIIKMNTGSGKTVVGLMILKSCLNEEKGPAIFVVPDNYLVQQVCIEAHNLGIKVVTDEDDIDYLRKKAILVINIQKLINGRSVFGMRTNNNVPIGSIIIDDVHACLATIETQYTIAIPAKDQSLYDAFVDIFSTTLKEQSENKFSDIVNKSNPYENMLIPFWAWQNNYDKIYTLLNDNTDKDYIGFSFPLLKDCFKLCNCMISAQSIEITPKCVPIHKISSFIRAERRIFMSATLADDSVFTTALDLNPSDIKTIISPEKADDIGDRLILFPQVMNKKIADDEVKVRLKTLSQNYNVVIIVPSNYRAKFWNDVADLELNSFTMEQGVQRLRSEHIGLVVLINKYDGIDLPNDACRILVIDGLPKMRSEYDCFEQNATPNNKRLCSEQIQKIEQGMGRAVRSNSDYCVVILLGRGLADIIYGSDGIKYFSDTTRQQFKLSEQLWDQLQKPNIDEIFGLAEYSLHRNIEWITASKDIISNLNYKKEPYFNSTSICIRHAFDLAESGRYLDAVAVLTEEKNKTTDTELKGLLKQYIAEYTNFFNPEEAQQILLSAASDNRMVLKPIQGIQFTKVLNKTGAQSQFLISYLAEKGITQNQYILKINAILEKLDFSPDTANNFEASIKELSFLLGIYSERPENETGKGPDNFWDVGNSDFFVIECKNGTITDSISKHDCNQLNGSINWFNSIYHGNSCQCYPVMIHNSNIFEYACSPSEAIRIMTPTLLSSFKQNIQEFSINLVKPDVYNNPAKINELLGQFNLLGTQIIDKFTKEHVVKKR